MTHNWDFLKKEYSKLKRFEVQVSSFKNCKSSIPLNEILIFKEKINWYYLL
jgi:hypothetical protein